MQKGLLLLKDMKFQLIGCNIGIDASYGSLSINKAFFDLHIKAEDFNIKACLGLPPLGIIGIPIRILGTQENPKFKYGKGNNDENVEETEYSDEIPKDILDKIKNAKEEDWEKPK